MVILCYEDVCGLKKEKLILYPFLLSQVSDDKQSLTAHFIQALPPLLKKYLPDADKIANLVTTCFILTNLTVVRFYSLSKIADHVFNKNFDLFIFAFRC